MTEPRNTPEHAILAVVSDPHLHHLLHCHLQNNGFNLTAARSSEDMCKLRRHGQFDLLILGDNLPDEDGLSICRRLRNEHDEMPIMLLATNAAETDRITSLEVGVDEYLSYPINPRELLARVNAILRRRGKKQHPVSPTQEGEIVYFGPYVFNLSTRTLMRSDVFIPMTSGEFVLLQAFARHPRMPLSRDKLAVLTRGRSHRAFDRSLDVSISRLRKLIEPNPAKPRYIQTVWGMGYVFVPDKC